MKCTIRFQRIVVVVIIAGIVAIVATVVREMAICFDEAGIFNLSRRYIKWNEEIGYDAIYFRKNEVFSAFYSNDCGLL